MRVNGVTVNQTKIDREATLLNKNTENINNH